MIKHQQKVQKTAKICTLGEIGANTKQIWIVLHGYGQLADYFIRNFEPIASGNIAVIAPEALSRFYQEGFSGRVGATWMTKEERISDIEDYISYLNSVYTAFIPQNFMGKIVVFGFSQGGATAARWVSETELKIDELILWCSVFPNDLKMDFKTLLSKVKTLLVYGANDPFLSEEHKTQIEFFKTTEPQLKVVSFDGKHEIPAMELKKFS